MNSTAYFIGALIYQAYRCELFAAHTEDRVTATLRDLANVSWRLGLQLSNFECYGTFESPWFPRRS